MPKEKTEQLAIPSLSIKKICPKCGWVGEDYGNGVGFTSTLEGVEEDWCMRCYIRETTKNVPKMEKEKKQRTNYESCKNCKKEIKGEN